MRTTLLNPTVWLLALTTVASAIGAFRRHDARSTIERVGWIACAWPVLIALVAMAGVGIGSRVVLGYLSPGAYAEEVLAARSFLDQRELYGGNQAEVDRLFGKPEASAPWATLPGITPCQASAMANRARFYTAHAHTPMLLLAGVPVVHVAGGRGLYVLLVLLSIGAVIAMAVVLMDRANMPWRSRQGVLIFAAIAGWQPVIAGIRQGDAVLPAAGLVVLAWYFAGRHKAAGPAIAAAVASCLALPAVGVLPAVMRAAPRAALLAIVTFAAALGATVAIAGTGIIPGFVQTMAETARTYAGATPNYGVAGRVLTSGNSLIVIVAMTIVLACSWWRARTTDSSFAIFLAAGLLAAPVVWSQHFALVFVPAIVLLMTVAASRSSLLLGAWSLLVLCFSLPDPAAARLDELTAPLLSASPLRVVPLALVIFWAWITFGRVSVERTSEI